MRRLHLIPIIRIATKANGGFWEKPKFEEINNWTAFLNSLNWVVQNRYVIISNEPNHANEWGGEISPDEYARYLKEFSQKLKSANEDFYILPAGFDASADGKNGTMEITRYIRAMLKEDKTVFDNIDAWNSHSYPNPNFSGTATVTGKGTVASFKWEQSLLKTLGVEKNFKIFITETGWSRKNLTDDEISERYKTAFTNIWNDRNVVAVTPFILNYPHEPFDHFSWKKSDGNFYPFYDEVLQIPKEAGKPKQIVKGDVLAAFSQPIMISGSDFVGAILAKNTGQSIWTSQTVGIMSESGNFTLRNHSLNEIEPMKFGLIIFRAAVPKNTGVYSTSLFLTNEKSERISGSFKIEGVVTKIDKEKFTKLFQNIRSYLASLI